MKRFIIFCISLILATGTTLVYLHDINIPYSYYVQKITDQSKKYDVIVLGTSHAWSFDHNINHLVGEHFNKEGNSIYYDLQNYLYLKEQLNPNALIILPISYFSFGIDENRTDRGINNSYVNIFYKYLPNEKIYNYSSGKRFQLYVDQVKENTFQKAKLLTTKKQAKNPKKKAPKIKNPTSIKPPEIDSSIIKRRRLNYIKQHSEIRVKDHLEQSVFITPEKNIEYLSLLIEDAQKSGYRPILVTSPYHEEYTSKFDKDWVEDHFYQHLRFITKKHHIPHLDYSSRKDLNLDDMHFTDSDHLSDEGIIIFNKIFQKDLKSLELID